MSLSWSIYFQASRLRLGLPDRSRRKSSACCGVNVREVTSPVPALGLNPVPTMPSWGLARGCAVLGGGWLVAGLPNVSVFLSTLSTYLVVSSGRGCPFAALAGPAL